MICNTCGNQNRDTSKFCKNCGGSLQNSLGNSTLTSGTILENRYKIIDLIKSGGMGAVYKAIDEKLDRIQAVKELIPPYGTQQQQLQVTDWFKREARILSKLDHPCLPVVFDYFLAGGRYYLVMNFIDGEDLETKLQKEGALPEEKVIEWAKQILHILDYLHNLNPPVIYRDIKPSNIMLHKDGRVMLVDFGIARVVHTDSQSQKTAIGTGGYAPVEQCRGKAEARSDLYALGATIHHLLTGIEPLPFKFEPLRKIMPSVSVELEGVIMKSLKDNLSERYSNAKEMLQALSFKKEVTVVPGKKQVVVMPKMKIKPSPVTVLKTCDYKKTSPEKIWEFEIIGEKGEFSPPCIANELIYFGASDDNFYCLNAENGNKIWEFSTEGSILTKPYATDGLVCLSSKKGNLYCLNSINGDKIWEFQAKNGTQTYINNRRVYFIYFSLFLYCLDAQSGDKIWEFMLQSLLDQRYIYIIDEYIYINDLCVMGRSDHSIPKGILYCLNAKNGVKIWEKSCIVNSDCLFVNRYLYFITNDGNFYCLEKTTGEEKYQYKTDKTGVYATLCITDAFIYFTIDNTLYCLDVESGRKIWKFQSSYNIKALQASDGYVYFSDNIDRNVYCLDGRTAKKVWEFKRRYSSSIRKRNVNFWMANGFIYLSRSCLDAKTGEELWVIPHEPFCIVDGYIYLQDNTRFYCMDTGNRGINAGN